MTRLTATIPVSARAPKTNGNGHDVALDAVCALMRDDLALSGLTEADMNVRASLTDLRGQRARGYFITYPDPETRKPSDYRRFRYLDQDLGFGAKRKNKYDAPAGRTAVYFSARVDWRTVRADTTQELFVTEGEKKCEAACKAEYRTLGLNGVYGFKLKGQEQLLPELEKFAWEGRRVYLVFDSDIPTNWEVQEALDRLAALLTARGAVVSVIHLPTLDERRKTGLDDYLVVKGRPAFDSLIAQAEEWQAAQRVLRSEPLYRAVEKAERILATRPKYKLFVRGTSLVRVVEEARAYEPEDVFRRPRGNTCLAAIRAGNIKFLLSKAGCVYQILDKKLLPAEPKQDWCEQVVERITGFPEEVPWRRLQLVTNTPLLQSDGSVVDQMGYHPETGTWFEPQGRVFPPLPPRPTRKQAIAAMEQFAQVFGKFPWAQAGGQRWNQSPSYAAVLATILSILVRHLLPTVPLLGITAPEAGTGKTKVAESIAAATTGCLPSRITYDNTEEFDKHLPLPLLAGDRIILIDNVDRKMVRSARLSLVLSTEAACRFRILGETREQVVLNRSVFITTGNQLAIAGDLPRRSLLARLLPNVAQPEERHFDFDPVVRAREMFPELVVAALTAMRYYLQAGCPQPKYAADAALESGSFETWNRVIRGSLVTLGFGDPLATQKEVRAENPMLLDDAELLGELARLFPDSKRFTAADIKRVSGSEAFAMLLKEGKWDSQHAGFRLRLLRDRVLAVGAPKDKRTKEDVRHLKLESLGMLHSAAVYRVVEGGRVG